MFVGFWTPEPNPVQLPSLFLYSHFHDVGVLVDWSVNLTVNGAVPVRTGEVKAADGDSRIHVPVTGVHAYPPK